MRPEEEKKPQAEPKPVSHGDFAAGERTSDVDETGTDFAAGERALPKDPNAHPDFARGEDNEA
jgi:hypothetical protein